MKEMKSSGIEWIGEIPADWDVLKVKYAFMRKNKKAMQENPIVLSLARNGVRKRDISTNEGQVAESYYNYNPVEIGDLLLNPMDLYSGANCSISRVQGVISPAYINLKNREGFEPRYYDYYFKIQYWLMAFFSHGRGVSFENRWTLNTETLLNYPLIVPDYDTQKHIANYLDNKCMQIDNLIEKQREIIQKLYAYKQSVITEAVTKGLDPAVPMKDSGHDVIGLIPSHWKIMKLRYIGKCQNGISKSGDCFGKGYPFVSYGDVYNSIVLPLSVKGLVESTEDERARYSVKEGDFFFTRTSETIEEIGLTSVCQNTITDATFAGFLIRVRPTNQASIVSKFSKYYFRSTYHRAFFAKEMNLVIRASLGQELLKKLPVLLPPKEEQIIIASYLDEKCSHIDSDIACKQTIIDKLTEYKKSLIYEVVTGKKEV